MKSKNKLFTLLATGIALPLATVPVFAMSSCTITTISNAISLTDAEWKNINQKELDSIQFKTSYTAEGSGKYKYNANEKLEEHKGIVDYATNFWLQKYYVKDISALKRLPNKFTYKMRMDPEHQTHDNNLGYDYIETSIKFNLNMDYYGFSANNSPVNVNLYYDTTCFDNNGNYIGGSVPLYNSWNYQFGVPYGNKVIRFDKYVIIDENQDEKPEQLLINELSLTSGDWIRNVFYENPKTKAVRNNIVVYNFPDAWEKQPGWAGDEGWPLSKEAK